MFLRMSGREAECARLEIVYTGWLVSGVQIPPHPPITKTGESRFFYCRQSRFVRRLAACPQRTGLRLGHLNSPRSPALSLLIKMFPRACRQKQPERRLFLLSASPHPPFWLKRRSFAASFFVSGGNAGFAGGWLCQNDYGKLVLCWKMQNFRHLHTLPIFKESL